MSDSHRFDANKRPLDNIANEEEQQRDRALRINVKMLAEVALITVATAYAMDATPDAYKSMMAGLGVIVGVGAITRELYVWNKTYSATYTHKPSSP